MRVVSTTGTSLSLPYCIGLKLSLATHSQGSGEMDSGTQPLSGEVARSHCLRVYEMVDVVEATCGKYNVQQLRYWIIQIYFRGAGEF